MDKFGFCNTKIEGNTLDINIPENWTGRFTTIRTFQTINFLKNLTMQLMKFCVKLPRFTFLKLFT